jgi:dipeptide/tripeptide permease
VSAAANASALPPPRWRFPLSFWTANLIELCERAAYYGWFIMLAEFLTSVVGYSDIEAGYIGGCFAALLYVFPFLSGAFADRVGYRKALLLSLGLLTVGYAGLGALPRKHLVLVSMAAIMLGGALVKPIITGTVARSSDAASRARAFSLFYMMVNIGSFLGKTAAKPVRIELGLSTIPLLSAAVAAAGFVTVLLFYRPPESSAPGTAPAQSMAAVLSQLRRDFGQVLSSGRLMALVLITAGFWIIQSQMYSSMPKYILRTVGQHASPEWYANVNPMVVVLCVVPITQLCRRLRSITSITIALGLIPLSALCIAALPVLLRRLGVGAVASLHPVTVAMLLGIALQGFAECFLSPRYLEYASKQAPKDQEALYLGYAHLNSFFSWLIGYILSGYLLDAFCPDPKKLAAAEQAAYALALRTGGPLPAAYSDAHYLWFVFVAIGVLAFLSLLLFRRLTHGRDPEASSADASSGGAGGSSEPAAAVASGGSDLAPPKAAAARV